MNTWIKKIYILILDEVNRDVIYLIKTIEYNLENVCTAKKQLFIQQANEINSITNVKWVAKVRISYLNTFL